MLGNPRTIANAIARGLINPPSTPRVAATVPASTAADVATLKTDLNNLIAKLKAAGFIANS